MSRLAILGGTPVRTKDFPSWPIFDVAEERSVLKVLRSGKWWNYSQGESMSQRNVQSEIGKFQHAFARFQGAMYAVACANGTAALEIALKSAGINPDDEVVVPPYSFIATASAPLLLGALPVFCDIESDTFNIDPVSLEKAITSRTRAIIPVHFSGLPANMGRILDIAKKHKLAVIEDAAHAHGSTWNGVGIGTLGDAGCFSFQASKNLTAGEGGAILTNNRRMAELCDSYVWAGREQGRPWYEHHRLGWNYRLTEFQAAILIEQLKRLEGQITKRMENALYLNAQLSQVPGIYPLKIPAWVTRHSFHIYVFRFVEQEFGVSRSLFLSALQKEGIPCSTGYAHPLYRNPMFLNQSFHANRAPSCSGQSTARNFANFEQVCPHAERACSEAVWIEHRVMLGSREDVKDIVLAVNKIRECCNELAVLTRSLQYKELP